MDEPTASEPDAQVRPLVGRLWRIVVEGRLGPALRAKQRRLFKRRDLILAGRALSLPLPEVGAPAEEIEYRLATADDGDLWKEHFPQKVDWYLERVRDPNQFCMLGITPGGELAVHCWYACGSFMDEDLGYRFETLEGCAYQGEGWVAPAHRRGGIAIECMRRVYNDILPARGFHTILCYFDATNMPSVKLHARLDFEERGRLRVLTLAGRNFFRMAETRA